MAIHFLKKKSCNQAVIGFFSLFSFAVHSYRWLCIFTEILAALILAGITKERLLLFQWCNQIRHQLIIVFFYILTIDGIICFSLLDHHSSNTSKRVIKSYKSFQFLNSNLAKLCILKKTFNLSLKMGIYV